MSQPRQPREHAIDACLLAAYDPPVETLPDISRSRSIGAAISRLDKQADLLIEEIRGRLPFHDTLRDIIERMSAQ